MISRKKGIIECEIISKIRKSKSDMKEMLMRWYKCRKIDLLTLMREETGGRRSSES